MTVHQQAYEVGAFAQYLRDLVARLDPGRGWYGVFARRDPAGMRSCLDGVEIPPWDVVESLLADLAALHGTRFAEQVSVRAAALYSASAAAHDRRPGGRQELVHRLELMVREQHRAAERLRGAGPGGPDPAEPDALAWARDDHERASARCAELRKRLAAVAAPEGWLRSEDGEGPRAGSGAAGAGGVAGAAGMAEAAVSGAAGPAGAGRVPQPRAEVGGAVAGHPYGRSPGAEDEPAWVDGPVRGGPAEAFAPEVPGGRGPEAPARPAVGPAAGTEPSVPADFPWAAEPHGPAQAYGGAEPPGASEPHGMSEPSRGPDAPAPRRKKPRGARFAGLEVDDEAVACAPSPLPGPPEPDRSGAPAPRGARFGGAAAEAEDHGGRGGQGGHAGRGRGRIGRDRAADGAPDPVAPDPAAAQAAAGAVARLVRLRAEGRSGEAHVVLCEVAAWPAPRLPLLALALHRAGLAADWTTLLWEVSSLPPAGFAAAAGALAAAGREADCGLLLRQGVARPAAEVADAALALDGAGREDRARDLLGAFVRVRTPQEAADLALSGGTRLVPLLLAAAREVSGEAEWDLVHALRVAGVPGV
ncbi:hypothetical protein AMK14_25550 [Streptomyces sp. TSRI0445]|uniref:hypothetical protein n=1 Tax=Streptomyces TaxID=1883 RepID=UPI00093A2CF3|nr:hypothetical protein [Streptomyces sp. TSRI0445]OKI66344.1 hypothetical protein AMK14_25550 [Streptomyces sp. TSRI0445]WSQ90691.1 hypothetical protein OG425_04440 [Streptomyces globisporus]WSV88694.1 hypothetical protein OG449_04750 [Streptomyces globisporus]GGW13678.1 hypothetical protein GCM10010264_54830 [Streptomyces globisporus]